MALGAQLERLTGLTSLNLSFMQCEGIDWNDPPLAAPLSALCAGLQKLTGLTSRRAAGQADRSC